MKPLLVPNMKWDCCAETVAPSLLVIFLLTAKAPRSASLAISTPSAVLIFHGWYKSKSLGFFSNKSASANPAQSSSAVCCAIWNAALTLALKDSFEKSLVPALPRLWPMNTVTPACLSRFCSMVSILPLRTETDKPLPSESSAAASVAPKALASANKKETNSCNCVGECENIPQS